MQTVIRNATFLTPAEEVRDQQLLIGAGKIERFEKTAQDLQGVKIIDARGLLVVPGFIDIHVHGADGHDTMDATPQAIHGMASFFAQHGVTSYLPTTVSAAGEAIRDAIANVKETPQPGDGAQHLGIHLEGPYLNHEYRGAQALEYLRQADPAEYLPWLEAGNVRLITLAPEFPGALELIQTGIARGVRFALGHTATTYEQARAAVDHGAGQVTHIFNGMPPMHHRAPGLIGAALNDDRLACQIIADGIHVHPAVVALLVRLKGSSRTILVTDAMRATGLPDGDYALGEALMHVTNGVARTDAGGLAGSTLTLDQGLRNVMQYAGLSLAEALPMATSTPAAAMGWQGLKGMLAPGADADLVALDHDHQVRMTMVAGEIVYNRLH